MEQQTNIQKIEIQHSNVNILTNLNYQMCIPVGYTKPIDWLLLDLFSDVDSENCADIINTLEDNSVANDINKEEIKILEKYIKLLNDVNISVMVGDLIYPTLDMMKRGIRKDSSFEYDDFIYDDTTIDGFVRDFLLHNHEEIVNDLEEFVDKSIIDDFIKEIIHRIKRVSQSYVEGVDYMNSFENYDIDKTSIFDICCIFGYNFNHNYNKCIKQSLFPDTYKVRPTTQIFNGYFNSNF